MATLGAEDRPVPTLASRATRLRPITGRAARRTHITVAGAARRLAPAARRARTAALSIGAAGAFTAAAWIVAVPFGLVVAGLALLGLEYLAQADR